MRFNRWGDISETSYIFRIISQKQQILAGKVFVVPVKFNQQKECDYMNQNQNAQMREKKKIPRQAQVNQMDRQTTAGKVHPVSVHVKENKTLLEHMLGNSADIKMREMVLGKDRVHCLAAYIEITAGSLAFENSLIGRLLNDLSGLGAEQIYESLASNGQGLCDVTPFAYIEDAVQFGMLTGDVILFIDGFASALKIPDKGYPNMGVTKPDSEKVLRGSQEGFADSVKVNTALIRKRIRSSKVRVKEVRAGLYSHTNIDLVYMEGLVYPGLLEEIERRLDAFTIDSVMDSGIIEQLAEEAWYSPFPQFQTTQRPDRAAIAVMEGRIVLLCDNSPTALILPTDYNALLKTSDDYYNRFEIASLERFIRYAASIMALMLPGLYLAVTNFHTQILPTSLLLSFAAARQGVPFPAVVEVLLMELSFELLREAGVRLPGAMGNTIGIVGGLIIGQAAVDANLVSPIVVIVVAFTALSSFAIPDEELATSFRILKFYMIGMSAWLGLFGFLASAFSILLHLGRLTSFGIPYLMPYVGAELNDYQDERDSVLRYPLAMMTRRPVYARRSQRVRLTFGTKKNQGKER